MGISVEGFGRRVRRENLELGDLAICRIEPAGSFLIMRVDVDEHFRFDVVLSPLGVVRVHRRDYPFTREADGDYILLEGEFVAEPLDDLPLPGDPENGALVLTSDGGAFIRLAGSPSQYIDLKDGALRRPAGDREYYPRWKLVRRGSNGKPSSVIATFPLDTSAWPAPPSQ